MTPTARLQAAFAADPDAFRRLRLMVLSYLPEGDLAPSPGALVLHLAGACGVSRKCWDNWRNGARVMPPSAERLLQFLLDDPPRGVDLAVGEVIETARADMRAGRGASDTFDRLRRVPDIESMGEGAIWAYIQAARAEVTPPPNKST